MEESNGKFITIANKRMPLVKEINLIPLNCNISSRANVNKKSIEEIVKNFRFTLNSVSHGKLKRESLEAFGSLNSLCNEILYNNCELLNQLNTANDCKSKEIAKETSSNLVNTNGDVKVLSIDKSISFLYAACHENNFQKLKICIDYMEKNFITINQESINNYTPLHIAIQAKADTNIIKYLLDKGACPLKVDYDNNNSMHHCVNQESTDCLISVIDYMRTNPIEVLRTFNYREGRDDPFNSNRMLPYEAFKTIYKIISTATDSEGNTPIMLCIQKEKLNFLMIILKHLRHSKFNIEKEVVNYKNPGNGNNAILILSNCIKGPHLSHIEKSMIILLIKSQADPYMNNYAGHNAIQVLKIKPYEIFEFFYKHFYGCK
ncbi:uncharacterized protein LOC143911101 [Arctopsyche grandis]|uniref:uncharacterized protein LOC143911101 n=1 Tax=Arctopsyche grandis TaxID=121162 RepID=UPI00406D7932